MLARPGWTHQAADIGKLTLRPEVRYISGRDSRSDDVFRFYIYTFDRLNFVGGWRFS